MALFDARDPYDPSDEFEATPDPDLPGGWRRHPGSGSRLARFQHVERGDRIRVQPYKRRLYEAILHPDTRLTDSPRSKAEAVEAAHAYMEAHP